MLSGCSQESRVLTEPSQRQILRNLSAVLEAGGSSLALVNKVNIFLVEPTDFEPMNEVYNTFFEGVKPVRV